MKTYLKEVNIAETEQEQSKDGVLSMYYLVY